MCGCQGGTTGGGITSAQLPDTPQGANVQIAPMTPAERASLLAALGNAGASGVSSGQPGGSISG